jgi:head-tail adaptor
MIESIAGKTVFDTTGVERVVSHKITTRYLDGITAESWVLFNGNRYDVVAVENLDERDEFSVMRCVFRGTSTSSVNAQ